MPQPKNVLVLAKEPTLGLVPLCQMFTYWVVDAGVILTTAHMVQHFEDHLPGLTREIGEALPQPYPKGTIYQTLPDEVFDLGIGLLVLHLPLPPKVGGWPTDPDERDRYYEAWHLGKIALHEALCKKVLVVCDPDDYQSVAKEILRTQGQLSKDLVAALTIKASDTLALYSSA